MSIRHQRVDCQRRRDRPTAALLLALAACSGCWEEIYYSPSAEPPAQSAADSAAVADGAGPAPEGEAAATDATVLDPMPPADQAAPPPTPSTSELFGSQEIGTEKPAAVEESPSDDIAAADQGPESILPTPPAPEEAGNAEVGEGNALPAATPPTPAERHQAWQAVSKWSLAAAIHAKGLPNAPQNPILAEATAAAGMLGIELPELPTASRDDNRQAAVIEGLRGELAVAVINAYANRLGEAEAAAADLAIRSHMLLLTYSPRNADSRMEAEALRRAGETSGFPPELWAPLVQLVEERAPFLEIRQAVFDLHRKVERHLSEPAKEQSDP